jgi:prophage DNA circulation protein
VIPMRDWTKTLRPASFRGVPFQVDHEGFAGGRNIATHEYVHSEAVISEDMGRKASRYKITAYIANDLADLHGAALIEALTRPGVGLLVLPLLGPVDVMISGDISTTHERDRLGYVGFEFEAVEAGTGSLFPSLALGDRLAVAAAATIGGLVRSFIGGLRP